jgi:adenylate cyclase
MAVTGRYPGGTELEISMLFVDVRGSTTLAERMTATDFAQEMNRFYEAATNVLIRTDAVIDKFVGDEVMAFYVPLFTGPNHARPAVQAAQELLRATRHGDKQGPSLPIGVGVHTGVAFVGTVKGAEGSVNDITALGDNVNVTARLASLAGPGEALISEAACARAGVNLGAVDQRKLELKGRNEPILARVLRASAIPDKSETPA